MFVRSFVCLFVCLFFRNVLFWSGQTKNWFLAVHCPWTLLYHLTFEISFLSFLLFPFNIWNFFLSFFLLTFEIYSFSFHKSRFKISWAINKVKSGKNVSLRFAVLLQCVSQKRLLLCLLKNVNKTTFCHFIILNKEQV